MKKSVMVIVALVLSLSVFAEDSQVSLVNTKTDKAFKITGAVAKEIYNTLAKKSANNDYKYGNGVTCTSSSTEVKGGYQCAIIFDQNGIK